MNETWPLFIWIWIVCTSWERKFFWSVGSSGIVAVHKTQINFTKKCWKFWHRQITGWKHGQGTLLTEHHHQLAILILQVGLQLCIHSVKVRTSLNDLQSPNLNWLRPPLSKVPLAGPGASRGIDTSKGPKNKILWGKNALSIWNLSCSPFRLIFCPFGNETGKK